MEEAVCSVSKENNDGYYRLHVMKTDKNITLNLCSEKGAWSGQLNAEKMVEISEQLRKPLECYLCETWDALTTPDGRPGTVYQVENNNFVWKSIDRDTGIAVKLGSIPLVPANFTETIQRMMDVSLETNKKFRKLLIEQESKVN